MNIDATPETIRAIARVLQLAAILDDRVGQADDARLVAWSEQVQRHNLTEKDLLDGLQEWYDQPRDRAIGIGDLIAAGRARKRNRLEREPDEVREARQNALEAKVRETAEARALSNVAGENRYRRPTVNALIVACGYCHAGVGRACTNGARGGAHRQEPHPTRIEAAEQHLAQPAVANA